MYIIHMFILVTRNKKKPLTTKNGFLSNTHLKYTHTRLLSLDFVSIPPPPPLPDYQTAWASEVSIFYLQILLQFSYFAKKKTH